jgi:beta-phosphoglucomutase
MAAAARALIFDFDGVLADTEPLIWKAWARLFDAHDIHFTWDDYCRFGRGVTDQQMLGSLPQLQSRSSLRVTLQNEMDAQQPVVRNADSQRSLIPDSTVSMLLRLSGFRIGLVTSSRRADVEPVLQAAGVFPCFRAVVGAEDCVRHKPDPEPYLLARKRLDVDCGLAFEDSDAGMASATAAGLVAVRVDAPHRLPEIVAASLRTLADQGT